MVILPPGLLKHLLGPRRVQFWAATKVTHSSKGRIVLGGDIIITIAMRMAAVQIIFTHPTDQEQMNKKMWLIYF